MGSPETRRLLPLWLKIAYTGFLAVMVPVYWREYGPTNFLYFCDVAAFLTLAALWSENALLASIAAVGIVLPQTLWIVDLSAHLVGLKLTGMSDYMFDAKIPAFTRAISLYHAWLPVLLVCLVYRLRYDRRALVIWTALAWVLMTVCYFWMPKPGTPLPNPKQPVNIDYVYGFSDEAPQSWMPEWLWFIAVMLLFPVVLWWPAHWLFSRFFAARSTP